MFILIFVSIFVVGLFSTSLCHKPYFNIFGSTCFDFILLVFLANCIYLMQINTFIKTGLIA